MRLKFLSLIAVVVVLFTGSVFPAVTGKITGEITDQETKEPLVGVSVAVRGTALGAITDVDGQYSVLNVPVGTYTIAISAVGYATLEVSNVHVSADLATYQSHALSSKATDLGKTIQVVAETPLVIKDKTTSVAITQRDQLLAMPVRGFEQVVGIQNSVVRMNSNIDTRQRGYREPTAAAPEINLRGGRPSEVAYYVDGFSQQDPLTGISSANISNNAIKEVSVQSGAFSAEYGHVASGIVNVVTNSGTSEYHGNLEIVTDNALNDWAGYNSFDQNYYTGDFSGPIPGTKKGFFFLSGERRWLGDRTPSAVTKDVYEKFGLDGLYDEPQRMPNNTLGGWSYQGKIDYEFTPTFKLELSGNGSVDSWQEYRHYFLNPDFPHEVIHTPRYKDVNLGLNAKVTHTLNANTFYNLSASYFSTSRKRGDGVVFDNYEGYVRATSNPTWDDFNLFATVDSITASDLGLIPLDSAGTAIDTFVTTYDQYYEGYLDRRAWYLGFKGDITSQMGSHHTVKAGFDFQRHTLRYFENLRAAALEFSYQNLNRYGFDSLGNTTDDLTYKNSTKHPINLGLYLQDRFEWRGLIVNAGLRFDYFDYKAQRLRSLTQPTDPDNPDPATVDGTVDPEDLEDSKKFTRVSPRLGISFPVSDKTQLHINYGKFFQRPDLSRLYVGYDFLENRIPAGSYYPFGSPNLEPEKTTQYEVGMTHQLGENTAFDLTAYYKDVQDLTQIFHQSPGYPRAYDFFANTDYGTIKGVDFSLTMRRTRNISIDFKYSLSYATGTGSYAQSTYNIAWKNAKGIPKQTNPLDFDQRHTIIAIVDLRTMKGEGPRLGDSYPLENFGLNTVIQLGSGTPYTPMLPYDAVSPNAAVDQRPTGSVNSANLPWSFTIDMKMEKTFKMGSYSIVPYIWVKNLLDRKNVVDIYEGTGKADVSGYLDTPEGQKKVDDAETGADYAYTYDLAQNNPKNYSNPRMFMLGLRVSF